MLEKLYRVALIDHVIEICLQLFKGKFYYCKEAEYPSVVTKEDCQQREYTWENKEYNFDNLAKVNHFCFFMCFFWRVGRGIGDEPAPFSFLGQMCCNET